jgi:hypothetical protein
MDRDRRQVVIVQSGPSKLGFGQVEAQRLDQMQLAAGGRRGPDGVARVGGDARSNEQELEQDTPASRSISRNNEILGRSATPAALIDEPAPAFKPAAPRRRQPPCWHTSWHFPSNGAGCAGRTGANRFAELRFSWGACRDNSNGRVIASSVPGVRVLVRFLEHLPIVTKACPRLS